MATAVAVVLVLVVLLILVYGSRALQSYWEQETNMSDDDYDYDRRVASYNDRLANQRRDDEIVRILGGQDMPTVADRYRRPINEVADDEDEDDDYDDDDYDDDDNR